MEFLPKFYFNKQSKIINYCDNYNTDWDALCDYKNHLVLIDGLNKEVKNERETDLEKRVRVLEDVEAIKKVKAKYWYCLERKLWDEDIRGIYGKRNRLCRRWNASVIKVKKLS